MSGFGVWISVGPLLFMATGQLCRCDVLSAVWACSNHEWTEDRISAVSIASGQISNVWSDVCSHVLCLWEGFLSQVFKCKSLG